MARNERDEPCVCSNHSLEQAQIGFGGVGRESRRAGRRRAGQGLAQLPGDPTVFPGHWYSAEPSASLSEVRRTNYVYRASNLEQWRMLMGG